MLHAVIMAGGSGTRFWPLSRRSMPKQFLTLAGERSLIQNAFDRCHPIVTADRFWVVTNQSMISTTADHLPEVPVDQLLAEPCARNTAPCVALAAMAIAAKDPEGVMLVMPADHVIAPVEKFQEAVDFAVKAIEKTPEQLVLFGVPPVSPATGFGYIERGPETSAGIYNVESFREKPDLETAESYVRDGYFYWNCGIFIWKAKTILAEIAAHQPQLYAVLEQLRFAYGTSEWDEVLAKQFVRMPSISIDYAVLEKSNNISVVEAPFNWDDVGSWEAMSRLNSVDSDGNTALGKACVVDSKHTIVCTSDDHVIGVLGMENCIVVHTPDATLVADRTDENAVRELVQRLKDQGYDNVL